MTESFPTDEATLNLLEHALGCSKSYDDEGNRITVGGDMTLWQFLEFMSGPSEEIELESGPDYVIVERVKSMYTETCVIRALLARVRELEQS